MQLPKNRIHPSRLPKDAPEWVKLTVKGRWYLRDGVDYKNTNHRYDKSHYLFNEAFELAKDTASNFDLARICLWNGISLNENTDLNIKTRNNLAIKLYLKGVKYLSQLDSDSNSTITIPVLASLYNSIGVGYHHLSRKDRFDLIPKKSIKYYKMSYELYKTHPELHRDMTRIMKKVESNSGWQVVRGGSASKFTHANIFSGNQP